MPAPDHARWDEVFDVVVVGSGGGALTAALLARDGGASVLVIEKDEFIGGTTAVSGGDMWVPLNRHIADSDSREEAIAYVTRLSDGRAADPSLIEVYVDTAHRAIDYLEAHTGYRSEAHYPLHDYYSVIGDRIPGVKPRRPPGWSPVARARSRASWPASRSRRGASAPGAESCWPAADSSGTRTWSRPTSAMTCSRCRRG